MNSKDMGPWASLSWERITKINDFWLPQACRR